MWLDMVFKKASLLTIISDVKEYPEKARLFHKSNTVCGILIGLYYRTKEWEDMGKIGFSKSTKKYARL